MKILSLIFTLVLTLGFVGTNIMGQVPPSFLIQGLAQDIDGNALVNQDVEIVVTLDGNALDHDAFVTTSSAGVFRVEVNAEDLADQLLFGGGFLEVTVNGIPLSTPLLSVPYALIADQVVNDQVEDDDADPTNEIQTLEFTDGKLIISGGNEISIPTGTTDADADPTNELQTLSFSDGKLAISDGNEITIPTGGTDADADPTNEFQTLSFSDGKLSISDGNEITIPTGGTDADADPTNEIQFLSKEDNLIVLSDGGSVEDEVEDDDADPSNELQALKISGNTLEIVPFGEGEQAVTLPDGGNGGGNTPWQSNGQDIYYSDGSVGIGENNPQSPLHVSGDMRVEDGDVSVRDGNNVRAAMTMGNGGGEIAVYDDNNSKVGFMKANGDFNDPQGPFGYLELSGPNGGRNVVLGFIGSSTDQDRGGIGLYNEGNNSWWMSPGASSDPDLGLYYVTGNNLQKVGEFSRTNGQYTQLSDRRVKQNIGTLTNVMSSLKALRPVSYNYIFDADQNQDVGFIAQEVEKEFPHLVDEMDDGLKGVNYAGFSVIAIKAIQEQQEIIEDQQRTIDQLMERVTKLEAKIDK